MSNKLSKNTSALPWDEVQDLAMDSHVYQEYLKKISPSSLKYVANIDNLEQVIDSVLKSMKKPELDKVDIANATKIAREMQVYAAMLLAEGETDNKKSQ